MQEQGRVREAEREFPLTGAGGEPDLAWVVRGAGRMIRSPTVFEDVVKTICTTNCAWSATIRMVSALVEHLGENHERLVPISPRSL